MQSTLSNSNCSFVKAFIMCFEQPPGHPATSWPRVASQSDPDCVGGGGWAVGGGAFCESCRKHLLLWALAFISRLQLDAVYVDCLMANWCSMCEDTVSCMRRLWVATWVVSTWYQFPQSIWSIQWKKKKRISPAWKSVSSYQRLLRHLGCLTRFFTFESIVFSLCYFTLLIWGNNLKNTEVTF